MCLLLGKGRRSINQSRLEVIWQLTFESRNHVSQSWLSPLSWMKNKWFFDVEESWVKIVLACLGCLGMDFLKIPFEWPLILVFHFEAKKKILVGIVTFHHWFVFINIGFMCGDICSTFVKIIESKPFVITDFFLVIYKEVIGVPFSCGGLVKTSSWRSLATMIGKINGVSWPCIDINGR